MTTRFIYGVPSLSLQVALVEVAVTLYLVQPVIAHLFDAGDELCPSNTDFIAHFKVLSHGSPIPSHQFGRLYIQKPNLLPSQ